MFAKACEMARSFTRPVVLSHRQENGVCTAGIGTFVVVNTDGWAVTVWHVVEEAERVLKAAKATRDAASERDRIRADDSLDRKERNRRLRALPSGGPASVTHASAWWSWDGVRLSNFIAVAAVDLAFVKLEPFDPAWVPTYPVFKDPDKDMAQGRSLCRTGFPFHEVRPTFDENTDAFRLPAGSIPLPFFPNEGILTRHVNVIPDPPLPKPPPFPLRFLETSSPGLRGQSGGPVFDHQGAIWGIQSRTMHFPLGFSPPVPDGRPNEKEHQFLNVGWAVHAATLVGAMRERKINFALSEY